jgi:hypothetical protein
MNLTQIASTPKKVVNHVYARRGRYCAAAGIITGAVITRNLDNSTRELALAFIEEKGLDNEFWNAAV